MTDYKHTIPEADIIHEWFGPKDEARYILALNSESPLMVMFHFVDRNYPTNEPRPSLTAVFKIKPKQ